MRTIIILCSCEANINTGRQIADFDDYTLNNNGYTSFLILKCNKCKGIIGFPTECLNIALEKGTEETKKKLYDLQQL